MGKYNIYKRKDGRFEGRLYCTENGSRSYRSFYGSSYDDVVRRIDSLLPDYEKTEITVRELLDKWLQSVIPRVKQSTASNYQMKLNRHILPYFSAIRCCDFSPSDVYSFINKKESEGLSSRYISDMIVLIKSAFRFAARTLRIFNPLDGVHFQKQERSEIQILNTDQQKKLTARFSNSPTHTDVGIALSLYTGLRIGEVCAMKWSDIDLDKRILTVNHTIQRIQNFEGGNKTRLVITEPKSVHSKRTIPIPDGIIPLLKRFQGDKESFILSGTDKPVEPRTMQNRFAAILKNENLPSVHYHSLRHAFATRAVEVGFDIKTLSEILGHSSVELTLNLYVHSSLERKRTCMNLMTV